jgi:hypothetical protein
MPFTALALVAATVALGVPGVTVSEAEGVCVRACPLRFAQGDSGHAQGDGGSDERERCERHVAI